MQERLGRAAIYPNHHGDVVIHQERLSDEREDVFIVIGRGHAIGTAYAVLEAAGFDDIYLYRRKDGGLCEDIPMPATSREAAIMAARPYIDQNAALEDWNNFQAAEAADCVQSQPRDRTGAERQRRYRAGQKRHKGNGHDVPA